MPLLSLVGPRARMVRRLAAAGVAGALLVAVTACTPQRTVANYCAAVNQHKDRYLSAMQAASGQGFGGLISSAAAIGDLQTMWSDLANVAPDDIHTDTETVRDAWTKVQDDASNHKLLAAATAALSAAPAMGRVNDYIAQHCGVDAAPVRRLGATSASPFPSDAPSPSPSDTPADTTPPGSVLVAVHPSSRSNWDAGPASVVSAATSSSDQSLLDVSISSVSDGVATTARATFSATSDGELRDWTIGTQHDASAPLALVFARIVHTDASGLDPETWAATIAAQDPGSAQPGTWYSIPQCSTQDCSLDGVRRFGSVGVLSYSPDSSGSSGDTVVGIDLTNGHVAWTRTQAKIVAVGDDQVILQDESNPGVSEYALTGVDTASGRIAWTFKDSAGDRADGDLVQLSDRLAVVPSTNPDDGTGRVSLIDLSSGHVLSTRWGGSGGAAWAYDPVADRVVVTGTARSVGAQPDLTVLSAETGQLVYAISPERFQKLGTPAVSGAYGGHAWITTTSGLDEVDTQTGAQSSDSPLLSSDGSEGLMLPEQVDRSVMYMTAATGADSVDWLLLNGAGNPSYQDLIALRTPR